MSKYTTPKVWGPYFWFVMRCLAYNYPTNPTAEEKKHHRDFYMGLQHLLPCKSCRKSYTTHIRAYPIDDALKRRSSLMAWVETIYNETNKMIKNQKTENAKTKTPMLKGNQQAVQNQKIVKKKLLANPIQKNPLNLKSRGVNGSIKSMPQNSISIYTPLKSDKQKKMEIVREQIKKVKYPNVNKLVDEKHPLAKVSANKKSFGRAAAVVEAEKEKVKEKQLILFQKRYYNPISFSHNISKSQPKVTNFSKQPVDEKKKMLVIKRCNCGQ